MNQVPAGPPPTPRGLQSLYNIDKFKYFNLIGYQPHPKQLLFHCSPARFKIPICGRRFGK